MKIRHTRFLIAMAGAALAAAAMIALCTLVAAPSARLLHTEPSEFAPVLVFEEYGERCMNFNTMQDNGRQTCVSLADPDRMVFAYTRMMASALFVRPDPKHVLIVGLGGATLPLALEKILPHAVIDSVEIDPAVARVAELYFGYRQNDRQRLFLEDGRAFVERAQREGRQYDMVMLDAFDVDYIPPHLLTIEFFQILRSIIAPDGVLVSNSFTTSIMYDRESATYAAVFGAFFNLRAERQDLSANRVIIAPLGPLPGKQALASNAAALADALAPFGIVPASMLPLFSSEPDWDQNAAVLTD